MAGPVGVLFVVVVVVEGAVELIVPAMEFPLVVESMANPILVDDDDDDVAVVVVVVAGF